METEREREFHLFLENGLNGIFEPAAVELVFVGKDLDALEVDSFPVIFLQL
jgi:hypothetical protein